jgi:hypothetical protein
VVRICRSSSSFIALAPAAKLVRARCRYGGCAFAATSDRHLQILMMGAVIPLSFNAVRGDVGRLTATAFLFLAGACATVIGARR